MSASTLQFPKPNPYPNPTNPNPNPNPNRTQFPIRRRRQLPRRDDWPINVRIGRFNHVTIASVNHYLPCLIFASKHSLFIPFFLSSFLTPYQHGIRHALQGLALNLNTHSLFLTFFLFTPVFTSTAFVTRCKGWH
jgi:hypothetical protein